MPARSSDSVRNAGASSSLPKSKDSTKKIVYLFGAGATHAELAALLPDLSPETDGLLLGNVSSRVIARARSNPNYLRHLETVSATAGSLNIELLIGLLESSKVQEWAAKTELLRTLVSLDIRAILTPSRTKRFYLHRALLRLHRHPRVRSVEQVIGFISLNYDGVLDSAYRKFYGEPNYCFSLSDAAPSSRNIPLLKLHGSFTWKNLRIQGRRREIDIIPMGSHKTYLHAPYGFIWTRALQILVDCDILRLVGCSLSHNDAHLTDLLFKAHLERSKAFEIQVIDKPSAGQLIRTTYGFFPGIRTLSELENLLVPEPDPRNPYRTWLKYKSLRMLGESRALRLSPLAQLLPEDGNDAKSTTTFAS